MSEAPRQPKRSRKPGPSVAVDAATATREGVEDRGVQDLRSFSVVARAVLRAQTRALVYEHLAAVAAAHFRGTDAKPPKLLLRVHGGGPYPAEIDDVNEIELELLAAAGTARRQIGRLLRAGVLADPADVDRESPRGQPRAPIPAGEAVVENRDASTPPTDKSARRQ